MTKIRKRFRNFATARAAVRNLYYDRRFATALAAVRNEKSSAELAYFAGSRVKFLERFRGVYEEVRPQHQSVNVEYFEVLIRRHAPDVLAVMGTCLLRKNIIDSAPLVLNLHTGLSPYYRGGMANFWPVIFDEPNCFGVTIHKISLGIDAGDIVFHGVPTVVASDGFATVNCKSIVIGSHLMVRAIDLHSRGTLVTTKQWSKGRLFFDRDFNGRVAAIYLGKKKRFFAAAAQQRLALPPRLVLDDNVQRMAAQELR